MTERIIHPGQDFKTPEERRRRSLAVTFTRRDDFEALLQVKVRAASNPVARDEIESLHPETRMAFGGYQQAREAAVAVGLIDGTTGEPR